MQRHYLADIIEPVVDGEGFETVRILTMGETNQTLQIMIEHKDHDKELTVDDCAKVSRAVSAALDEADPIEIRYTLEVSSPGIDRPLVKLDDFDRFKGFEAKIECQILINGRKRFSGRLQGIDGSDVVITFDGVDVRIPFDQIAKAKLILTDELLAAFASQSDEE